MRMSLALLEIGHQLQIKILVYGLGLLNLLYHIETNKFNLMVAMEDKWLISLQTLELQLKLASRKTNPSIFCCRMTSSLIFIWSPAGPNQSRAGRRPLSTAFTEVMANLQSPKSSPRVERADTPCSVRPTLARTQDGAKACPASWNGFFLRYQVLSRVPQVARLRHGWLLAQKPKGLISTSCCSRLAQTDFLPRSLLVLWMVKSFVRLATFKVFYSYITLFLITYKTVFPD